MQFSPFPDEPERACRQLTEERFSRRDHDLRLVLAVDGVEVRRLVVAVIHRDHDPVEGADPRHRCIVADLARFDQCPYRTTPRTTTESIAAR
jgi:hypothetical protein